MQGFWLARNARNSPPILPSKRRAGLTGWVPAAILILAKTRIRSARLEWSLSGAGMKSR